MTTKQRYENVIGWFERNMPIAETELHYSSPFELLVAVILSAQCTDKRVNLVTPALFAAYSTPQRWLLPHLTTSLNISTPCRTLTTNQDILSAWLRCFARDMTAKYLQTSTN